MGIFKDLFNRIFKNDTSEKKISDAPFVELKPAKKLDLDATQGIATIDKIEKIIFDKEEFNKFINFDKNYKEFVDVDEQGIRPDILYNKINQVRDCYIEGVKCYYEYFAKNGGIKFSREEMSRIKRICIDFEETNENKLYKIATSIIRNKEISDEFLKQPYDKPFYGYDKLDILNEIPKVFGDMRSSDLISSNREESLFNYVDDLNRLINRRLDMSEHQVISETEAKNLMDLQDVYNVARDHRSLNKFLKNLCNGEPYRGVTLNKIQNVTNKFSVSYNGDFTPLTSMLIGVKRWNDINSYEELDMTKEINPNFERLIMEHIPDDVSQEEKAYMIYAELAKKLRYNTGFYLGGQDLSRKWVRDIYDEDISSLTNTNNEVACSSFSRLYAYLLNKNGIEAHVVKKAHSKHKFVRFEAKDENGHVNHGIADATNMFNPINGFSLPDIVGIKMDSKPIGFVYPFDIEKYVVQNQITDLDDSVYLKELHEKYLKYISSDSKETEELISTIKPKIKGEIDDSDKSVLTKLNFINNQINRCDNLGGMEKYIYLNNITKLLFHSNEEDKFRISAYFKRIDSGDDGERREYKEIPVFRYKTTDGENLYFTFNKDRVTAYTRDEFRDIKKKTGFLSKKEWDIKHNLEDGEQDLKEELERGELDDF